MYVSYCVQNTLFVHLLVKEFIQVYLHMWPVTTKPVAT